MQKKYSVLLIGMGSTAHSALESLAKHFNVLGVVRDLNESAASETLDAVGQLAATLKIPVFSDTSISGVEDLVLRLHPDCVVISSYNRVLKPEILKVCPHVNVHYSPLPRYRGRANVNWAVINQEPCAAITIHVIAHGLDAGNILFQRLIPIADQDTVGHLYFRLNELQREYLSDAVLQFLDGYRGLPQEEGEATYGCTRTPEDGLIDWSSSTAIIDSLIRGLSEPFPGAFTYLGETRLIVWEAVPLKNPPRYVGRVPGRVIARSGSEGYVDVLTGDGVLRLSKVQTEQADLMDAATVIKSVRATLGVSVPDLMSRMKRLEQQVEELSQRMNQRRGDL